MKSADEARVIEARVASLWSSPPSVYFEEQPRPDGASEFLAVFVRPGRGAHLYLGQPAYRYAGVVIAQVFVKPETGTRRARELGDLFAALWYNANPKHPISLTDGTAGTLRFKAPHVGDIARRDGWLQLNVSVAFERDVSLS